mgnify:FL=1
MKLLPPGTSPPKNALVSRLRRALAHDGEDVEISDLAEHLGHCFVAMLPPHETLRYERIVERLARAAEELGEDATVEEIRARAEALKRQPL